MDHDITDLHLMNVIMYISIMLIHSYFKTFEKSVIYKFGPYHAQIWSVLIPVKQIHTKISVT